MDPPQGLRNAYPSYRNCIAYGRDARQTLDICLTRPTDTQDANRFWVIYIHGGAWRDPEIDSTSFSPTLSYILGEASVISNIAGFASINYRLSSYPSHPSDPSSSNDPSRNAKHPNHIHDVLNALRFLQKEYGFGQRYLLVGHSCGATLAFQVAMIRRGEGPYQPGYEKPMGILGLEGIYDMVALRDNHKEEIVYQEIIENVFGADEAWWKACSPVSGDYNKHWPNGCLIVLAQSFDDEMVEKDQMLRMKSALTKQHAASVEYGQNTSRIDTVRVLHGKHDDVWKDGKQMAESIEAALHRLVQMS